MGLFIFKTYKEAAVFAKQKACEFSSVKVSPIDKEFKVELDGEITKVEPPLVNNSPPKKSATWVHQPYVKPPIKLATDTKRRYANTATPKPLSTNEAMQLAYSNLANSKKLRAKKQSYNLKKELTTASKINTTNQNILPQKFDVQFDVGTRFCLKCGVVIPNYRVNEFDAVRCIKCQTQFELNHDTRQKSYEGPTGSRDAHLRMYGGRRRKK